MKKVGRNDLCPCGSGKKYKKCCSDMDIKNEGTQSCFTSQMLNAEQKVFKQLKVYIDIVSFFECSKCGECCRGGPPDIIFSDEYHNFDKGFLFWEDGMPGLKSPCPFFVDNTCKIHNTKIKPRVCRVVPFVSPPAESTYPYLTLTNCKLGKKIVEAYHVFLEKTHTGYNDTIFDIIHPLSDIKRAKKFLNWLEKNKKRKSFNQTAECAPDSEA